MDLAFQLRLVFKIAAMVELELHLLVGKELHIWPVSIAKDVVPRMCAVIARHSYLEGDAEWQPIS